LFNIIDIWGQPKIFCLELYTVNKYTIMHKINSAEVWNVQFKQKGSNLFPIAYDTTGSAKVKHNVHTILTSPSFHIGTALWLIR